MTVDSNIMTINRRLLLVKVTYSEMPGDDIVCWPGPGPAWSVSIIAWCLSVLSVVFCMINNQMIQISQCEQAGLGVFTAPAEISGWTDWLWLQFIKKWRNKTTNHLSPPGSYVGPTLSTHQDVPLVSQKCNERESNIVFNVRIRMECYVVEAGLALCFYFVN